jgi:predicted DNA-binding transcriptional regulator AlpA
MSTSAQPPRGPVLVDVPGARRELGGIGRTTLYRIIADGKLMPVRVKGRTMFDLRDIEAYVDASKDRRPTSRRAA